MDHDMSTDLDFISVPSATVPEGFYMDADLPDEEAALVVDERKKTESLLHKANAGDGSLYSTNKKIIDSTDTAKRQGFQEHSVPCKVLKMDKNRPSVSETNANKEQQYKSQNNVSLSHTNESKLDPEQFAALDSCTASASYSSSFYGQCLPTVSTDYPDQSEFLTSGELQNATTLSHRQSQQQQLTEDSRTNCSYEYVFDSPYHTSYVSLCKQLNTMTASNTLIQTGIDKSLIFDCNFYSQSESDLGYSSHSTDSSCQGQQVDGMYPDQFFQVNPQSRTSSLWDGNEEVEDLVYHFGKFFQDQFDSKLQQYQEDVTAIIEAQKNHVRRIVHTVMADETSQKTQKSCATDALNAVPQRECMNQEPKTSTDVTSIYLIERNQVKQSPKNSSVLTSNTATGQDQKEEILELMTLACGISTLLAKPQFHT